MKILRFGQEPHVEVDYEAIEIAPNEYITWDHLNGFNSHYRSSTLDLFDSGIIRSKKQHAYPDPYFLQGRIPTQYTNGYLAELTNEEIERMQSHGSHEIRNY